MKFGTVLPDLLSHEVAFWQDDQLVREEVTFLPDGSYAFETNALSVDGEGTLTTRCPLTTTPYFQPNAVDEYASIITLGAP